MSTEDNLAKPREDDIQPTPEWHRARGEIPAQEPKQTAAVIENSGPQEIFHGVDCRDPGNLGTPRSTACCFACEGGSIPALNPQTGRLRSKKRTHAPAPGLLTCTGRGHCVSLVMSAVPPTLSPCIGFGQTPSSSSALRGRSSMAAAARLEPLACY
jgi:hypothetical protein